MSVNPTDWHTIASYGAERRAGERVDEEAYQERLRRERERQKERLMKLRVRSREEDR